MKKTIVAVMVAASAVLSAQAMATNTAQVTVLGEVSDAANSCVVTPTGTLNNGIVQLITVTTTEANAEAAGKLFKTQDFGFDVKDCAQGSWRRYRYRYRYPASQRFPSRSLRRF